MTEQTKLLTAKQVLEMTGYRSRTTLWRRVRAGDFPTPIALSANATRWKRAEIEAWLAALPGLKYGQPPAL